MGGRVSLEDYISIGDFLSRYCWAVDEASADEWVSLWTEDGSFYGVHNPPLEGKEMLKTIPTQVAKLGGKMRHGWGNMYADYGDTKDVAILHLYNTITLWSADGASGGQLMMMALCEMTLVRHGETWLAKRNEVRPLR